MLVRQEDVEVIFVVDAVWFFAASAHEHCVVVASEHYLLSCEEANLIVGIILRDIVLFIRPNFENPFFKQCVFGDLTPRNSH